MKPLHIGLLVLAGALGGAMVVKLTERPAPVPEPVVAASPAPVTAVPAPPEPVAEPAPSPFPEKNQPVAETPEPVPLRVEKPVKPARPSVVRVARSLPPPMPETPAPMTPAARVYSPPQPEPMPAPEPVAEPVEAPAPPPVAPSVHLKPGLLLNVRIGESLSSERNQPGDTFTATLDAPLAADGFVIAERGARLEGRVVEVQKGSRVNGQAALSVELTRLHTSDDQYVPIKTDAFRMQAPKQTGENVGIVAAAAGVGAIIGAMAGGGRGAGIGAGVGGVAGAGGVAARNSKAAELRSETKVGFRLREPVTLTERTNRY